VPPLPVISGRDLVSFMESFGYRVVRQRGSHIRLQMVNERGTWPETVPDHREVARGTLRSILRRMSMATGLDVDELVCRLTNR
jgi:predicted RNA binding protein YcfA (HicA-like mRNA interferase family)